MPEIARDGLTCVTCNKSGDKKCLGCHSVTYCCAPCQKQDWVRHKKMCFPVVVKDMKDRGKGLVASKDIKMGALIVKEKGAVTMKKQEAESGPEILRQLNNISKEERKQFYSLTKSKRFLDSLETHIKDLAEVDQSIKDIIDATAIFQNNVITLGTNETCSVYLSHSLLNHSCAPNSSLVPSVANPGVAELRAIRDIKKEEEITVSYILGWSCINRMERQKELNKWGFICDCSLCGSSEEENIIQETSKLVKEKIGPSLPNNLNQLYKVNWGQLAQHQNQLVDYLQKLSNAPLVLPVECSKLVCFAHIGREQVLVEKGVTLLRDIIGKRKVELYQVNFENLTNMLKTWSKNLKEKLPIKEKEFAFFFNFKIDSTPK